MNGKLYAIGGSTNTAQTNAVEEYDPNANTWRARANMPTSRGNLALAVAGGKIYAVGGSVGPSTGATDVATVEAYDPATNTWAARAPMPTARGSLAAVTGGNGHIYAIGGYSNPPNVPRDTVEEYDPASNTWSS